MTHRFSFSVLIRLMCIALLLQLGACSTFKSNGDASFSDVDIGSQKPVIFVGDLTEALEEITYLGWIEARVGKSNWWSKVPTKRMVDIVLAELAKKQGAHAVTFIEYHRNMFGTMTARGQAVRLDSIVDEAVQNKRTHILQLKAKADIFGVPVEEYIKTVEEPKIIANHKVNLVMEVLINNNNRPIDLISIPSHDIISILDNLMLLREQASGEKDFERYQLLTESIDLLKAHQ